MVELVRWVDGMRFWDVSAVFYPSDPTTYIYEARDLPKNMLCVGVISGGKTTMIVNRNDPRKA
jgi:hypothetical protein